MSDNVSVRDGRIQLNHVNTVRWKRWYWL